MSKITEALKKADEERKNIISPMKESKDFSNKYKTEGKMRKSWLTWVFIVIVVTIFIVFNYQQGKDAVPLSEIFPDEEVFPVDVEYEFVQEEGTTTAAGETKQAEVPAPVKAQEVAPVQTQTKDLVAVETKSVEKVANYTIQIASFKDKKRAEEALQKIKTNVPSAYMASRDLGDKGIWYRIYAGQFDQRGDAELSLNDIKQNYDSSFIISPKK